MVSGFIILKLFKSPRYHERLVSEVNTNPSSTWRASYNKFASRSPDGHAPTSDKDAMRQALAKNIENNEWSKAQMFADTEEHLRYLISSTTSKLSGPLPRHFDAREQWPLCDSMHEVVNQGGCGSCWAMASTAVMSDRVCVHSNSTQQVRISAQDLIECCPHCGGCGGTVWALFSFVYWKEHGLVSGGRYGSFEGCKPYEHIPNCGYPCHLDIHGTAAGDGQGSSGSTSGWISSFFGGGKEEHRPPHRAPPPHKDTCWQMCQPLYHRLYSEDLHQAKSVYWLRPNALNAGLYQKTMTSIQQMIRVANTSWEEVGHIS